MNVAEEYGDTCARGHPWTPESTAWNTSRGYRYRQCRTCRQEVQNARRRRLKLENPDGVREARRRKRRRADARKRELVRTAKGDRCQDCGGRFPSHRLHFHHRDPAAKAFEIAWATSHRSRAAILAEIAKCDVLCVRCHNARHGRDVRDERGRWRTEGVEPTR